MNTRSILNKFAIAAEREDYATIHDTMEKGIYFKGTNLWILIFAIFIACVGLNVNSTAVIIGAMLVSPLMGPILGMGYSLATYDFKLLRKALVNFAFAVVSSLLTSTLYFFITPLNEAHSELLARTQPNIYDVIIALVGGLAGVLALSSKQKGNVIPGVAIATALMPPLCTAGYGLASGAWSYFFGAFYLFTINTVFIGVATLITVRFLKYPIWNADQKSRKTANQWVTVIVLLTIIPSIYFGYILVQREKFVQNANLFIRSEGHIEGDYLLKSEVDPIAKTIKLIYGGRLIAENIKKEVIGKAKHYNLGKASVSIQQGFSVDDDKGKGENLIAIDRQEREIDHLRNELAQNLRRQDSIRNRMQLGKQLLTELKPIYPDIRTCGVSEQTVYNDSLKPNTYMSLFIGTTNRKKLVQEREKIESWFRSRIAVDSIKIYIE
ncbi:MAG: DUF389 domain-containing protein [Agriterribacter sp.]